MSEEGEKLEAIKQEIAAQNYYQNETNKHLWWLSTFLVKVPLALGTIMLIWYGIYSFTSNKTVPMDQKMLGEIEREMRGIR